MKPRLDVVVIGVNVENTIDPCLRSVLDADYPRHLMNVIYVDGGSRDESVARARAIREVNVIELRMAHPTPGAGRNAGFRAGNAPFVLFLDGDTILRPDWPDFAIRFFRMGRPHLAAITGPRHERYPLKNVYHRITEWEWDYPTGYCEYFGGDVMVRRGYLELTGGFDEQLIAGEDPELSRRIRGFGGLIYRSKREMTTHDINMTGFRSYARRSFRSGHAYLEVALRYAFTENRLWLRQCLRIPFNAMGPVLAATAMTALLDWRAGLAAAVLLLARPLPGIVGKLRKRRATWKSALAYLAHLHVSPWPQLAGMIRFAYGKIFNNPARNRGIVSQFNTETSHVPGRLDSIENS